MSALHLPLTVTLFRDVKAETAERRTMSLHDLAEMARATLAPAKAGLPLLKLATFGDQRTRKNSLRHTPNMLSASGLEVDYDSQRMSVEEAAELIRGAGLAAVIYTSPSHLFDLPRWRVLCPFSHALPVASRREMAGKLNAVLGGVLARESFTDSQSFYIGQTAQSMGAEVMLVPGECIDLAQLPPPVFPPRQAAERITLPPIDRNAPPDARAQQALAAAVRAFDAPRDTDGRHQVLLAATRVVAPFVKSGHLDYGRVVDDLGAAMTADGRAPNDEEIESALVGAVLRATAYADGSEFGEFPPLPALTGMRARFMFPADCMTSAPRGYLVKHLLAPGDVAALIGPPSSGKSVIAPHFAYAVAQGREVFGLRTKPGRVLYACAEDASGMRQRVRALYQRHGDAPDFATVDLGNLRDPGTAKELRAAAADWRPALLVIDTLGAAWAGLDENSSTDMGEVVALARSIAGTGCAVLLIHHIAKHGDGSPRGHSVLNGTLDMCLALTDRAADGTIRAKLLKNRNGGADREMAFRIDLATLGTDEDGDRITAPVAAEVTLTHTSRPKLNRQQTVALEQFRKLEAETAPDGAGIRAVSLQIWKEECALAALSASDNRDNQRTAFNRTSGELYRLGWIAKSDTYAWRDPATDRYEASETDRDGAETESGHCRDERDGHPIGVRPVSVSAGAEFVQ